jgi:hypothetical protein
MRLAGADIQRHRGADVFAAYNLTDHHTAHRVVGAPAGPADEAGEREMPDLELSGPSRIARDRRGSGHHQYDNEESSSAIKAFGKRAEKHPEETHGKQPEHGHHRDQKRRIGALVDDNSNRDGFQPAHGGDDRADIPQTPEVGRTGFDHPPERRVAHAIAPWDGLPRYGRTNRCSGDRTGLSTERRSCEHLNAASTRSSFSASTALCPANGNIVAFSLVRPPMPRIFAATV